MALSQCEVKNIPYATTLMKYPNGSIYISLFFNDVKMSPTFTQDPTNCGLSKVSGLNILDSSGWSYVIAKNKEDFAYCFSQVLDAVSDRSSILNFEMSLSRPQWNKGFDGLNKLDEYIKLHKLEKLKGKWHIIEGRSRDRVPKNKFMIYTIL